MIVTHVIAAPAHRPPLSPSRQSFSRARHGGTRPRGGFGVFEPELRYVHDKVYATIVVPEGYGAVEARLVGPGAPSTPLKRVSEAQQKR